MVETAQAKQSLADIEARHGDIMKLEKVSENFMICLLIWLPLYKHR